MNKKIVVQTTKKDLFREKKSAFPPSRTVPSWDTKTSTIYAIFLGPSDRAWSSQSKSHHIDHSYEVLQTAKRGGVFEGLKLCIHVLDDMDTQKIDGPFKNPWLKIGIPSLSNAFHAMSARIWRFEQKTLGVCF